MGGLANALGDFWDVLKPISFSVFRSWPRTRPGDTLGIFVGGLMHILGSLKNVFAGLRAALEALGGGVRRQFGIVLDALGGLSEALVIVF